jgi:antirestriction protein ArdC
MRVAGYRAWQALGRQVKKGETGIRIFVPFRRRVPVPAAVDEGEGDEAETQRVLLGAVTGFGVGTVFDVTQTEGEPLPVPPTVQDLDGTSEVGTAVDRRLARFLLDEGLRLTKEDTGRANGFYRPGDRLIAISDRLTGDQQTKTLTHEAAHYLADHRGAIPREDAETVAESATFVVLSHFGMDTGAYSFPYVATWAQDKQVLKRNLGEIQQVASQLITAIGSQELVPEAHLATT